MREHRSRSTDHVDHAEVDLVDIRSSTTSPPGSRRVLAVVAVAVVVMVALSVGLVLRSGERDGGDSDVGAVTAVELPSVAQLLAQMPAGPIDGKQSWRLPVLAQPRSDLVDGQLITALGKGFVPGEQVGIVMCTSEAGTEGVAACDLGVDGDFRHVTYADADPGGTVIADVAVRQIITTPFTGVVDCSSAAERCIVAIGAVGDYDRSGGTPIGFAGQPPFPIPTLVVEPAGPYEPGQSVAARSAGLVPGREIQLLQCRDDRCHALARGLVAADGTFDVDVVVVPSFPDRDGLDVVCEGMCVLSLAGISIEGASAAPMPVDVPVEVAAPPVAPAEPPPTAPVPSEPIVTVPSPTIGETVEPSPVTSAPLGR